MYIKRHAEKTVNNLAKMFGAILVSGPRQVGKTTMLQLIDKIPNVKRGAGGVICLYDNLVTLKGNDRVIPINFL